MKRLLFWFALVVVILSVVPCAQGQTIGFKAGLNLSNLTNVKSEYFNLGTKAGMLVGIFYRHDLSDTIAIQPELYYSMKGVGDSGTYNGNEWSVKFKIDYLDFPILVKYRFPVSGKVEPNLFMGPYLSIKLNAKTEMRLNDESVSEDVEDIRKLDFGFTFGAGIDYEVGKGRIVLDARYSFGLVDVSTEGLEKKTLHRVFSLMLGYCF